MQGQDALPKIFRTVAENLVVLIVGATIGFGGAIVGGAIYDFGNQPKLNEQDDEALAVPLEGKLTKGDCYVWATDLDIPLKYNHVSKIVDIYKHHYLVLTWSKKEWAKSPFPESLIQDHYYTKVACPR